MSTTVLEALQNAQINLETAGCVFGLETHPFFSIAKSQLDNGIKALENGLTANDVIQENIASEVKTGGGS